METDSEEKIMATKHAMKARQKELYEAIKKDKSNRLLMNMPMQP